MIDAVYGRIVVAGPDIVRVRLTSAAHGQGLALTLPEQPEQIGMARTVMWSANLTLVSVVLPIASFVVMTATYVQVAGTLPATAPQALPPKVVGLIGWANRLLVVVYCAWVSTVAWHALWLGTSPTTRRPLATFPSA